MVPDRPEVSEVPLSPIPSYAPPTMIPPRVSLRRVTSSGGRRLYALGCRGRPFARATLIRCRIENDDRHESIKSEMNGHEHFWNVRRGSDGTRPVRRGDLFDSISVTYVRARAQQGRVKRRQSVIFRANVQKKETNILYVDFLRFFSLGFRVFLAVRHNWNFVFTIFIKTFESSSLKTYRSTHAMPTNNTQNNRH